MKKRLRKKLYTDKAYGGELEDILNLKRGNTRHRAIFKSKVKEGKITVTRIKLDITYKQLENLVQKMDHDDWV